MADEFFGFGLVPPTYTDEEGNSHMLFLHGTVDGDEAQIKGKKLAGLTIKEFTNEQLEQLQMKAALNFFLGDLDGKDDKIRLKVIQGELIEIFETDNDNILPNYALTKKLDFPTLLKTHKWKTHKWAALPFQFHRFPRLNQVLTKLFNPKEVFRFMALVKSKYPKFWTAERGQLMVERIATMQMAVEDEMPLSELGKYYSPESNASQKSRGDIDRRFLSPRPEYLEPHPRAEVYADLGEFKEPESAPT